jgi:hypothetical protein
MCFNKKKFFECCSKIVRKIHNTKPEEKVRQPTNFPFKMVVIPSDLLMTLNRESDSSQELFITPDESSHSQIDITTEESSYSQIEVMEKTEIYSPSKML